MNLTHDQVQMIADQILTPVQAAEVALVSPRTIYRFIELGKLRTLSTVSGCIRIWQPDAEKLRGRLPND